MTTILLVVNNNVKNVRNSLFEIHKTKENIKVTIEESPWKWLKLMILR